MGAVATELMETVRGQGGGMFLPSYLQASKFKYTHTQSTGQDWLFILQGLEIRLKPCLQDITTLK